MVASRRPPAAGDLVTVPTIGMRRLIQQSASPDGWNIGWNVEPVGG